MIGHLPGEFPFQFKPACFDEFQRVLAHVNHFKVHHELSVFVLEGMIAMRRGNDYFTHTVINESLDIFPGKFLENFFTAGLADAFAAAAFLFTQYAEFHTGRIEDIGCSHRHFFHPGIIAQVAADKIEGFHSFGV